MSEADLGHFFIGVLLLLTAAKAVGALFVRWHQPRVIGEIVGGLMLGPTAFGAALPEVQAAVFPTAGAVPAALAALNHLGLSVLMFVVGLELRAVLSRPERRTAIALNVGGLAVPFAIGVAVALAVDLRELAGPAGDYTSLVLVFAASIAITSIPIISRIMLDLGLIRTSFARIVLGAAILEDLVLYALLAVAIGLAAGPAGFGLAHELGIDPSSAAGAAYYVSVSSMLLAVAVACARPTRARPFRRLLNRVRNDATLQFVFLLAVVSVCLTLNVTLVFGGLVAGLLVGLGAHERSEAMATTVRFGFALLIPLYFALVGFRLDLLGHFDPLFFAAFLAFACAVKSGGVFVAARLAGEPSANAHRFAVAMNARGGPGIVLASVAFDARIIDEGFFVSLVMLAIVTSLLAGWWLERSVRTARNGSVARVVPYEARPGPQPITQEGARA